MKRTSLFLIPLAVRWAEQCSRRGARKGRALNREEMRLARKMGVREAQKIRLVEVDEIPIPSKGILGLAARYNGFFASEAAGMSLGYTIFIQNGWVGCPRTLLAHECVHTAQFERLGGMSPYLRQYLEECFDVGYSASPLEQEAVRLSTSL